MRKTLVLAILLLSFGSRLALAADVSTNAVVEGNKGYVYGVAPKVQPVQPNETPTEITTETAETTTEPAESTITPVPEDTGFHPIGGIFNAVKKLDAWVQKNVW